VERLAGQPLTEATLRRIELKGSREDEPDA
jgi:hypothetical protein